MGTAIKRRHKLSSGVVREAKAHTAHHLFRKPSHTHTHSLRDSPNISLLFASCSGSPVAVGDAKMPTSVGSIFKQKLPRERETERAYHETCYEPFQKRDTARNQTSLVTNTLRGWISLSWRRNRPEKLRLELGKGEDSQLHTAALNLGVTRNTEWIRAILRMRKTVAVAPSNGVMSLKSIPAHKEDGTAAWLS